MQKNPLEALHAASHVPVCTKTHNSAFEWVGWRQRVTHTSAPPMLVARAWSAAQHRGEWRVCSESSLRC